MSRGLDFIGETRRAFRHAGRALVRSPWFTVVAVLTLGLGLGVNTGVFSVIRAVLLAPLPYDDAGRLMLIHHSAPLAGQPDVGVSIKELYEYREQLSSFDALVEFHQMDFDLLRRGDPDRVATGVVSHNFFDVLGIRPLAGRTFVEADDRPGAEAVLVLGYAYWQSRFGGDPSVVGQVLEMNDRAHTVVGVLPDTALYPNVVDVYMPTSACPFRAAGELQMAGNRRAFSMLRVFGLRKTGVSPETAAAEVAAAGRGMARDFPDVYRPEMGFRADTLGVQEALTENARPMLLVLLGITALVLLLACTNVANLMLARTIERDHERATRAALGAGRLRLLAQPLAESALVALAGAVVGLVFAFVTLDLLASFVARFTSRAGEIGIDWTVLCFTIGVSVLAAAVLGILPALGARVDLAGALKAGTKGGVPRGRLRNALVAGQVAVSVVLLAAAGLLLLSVSRLQGVDPGYRGDGVVSAEIFANFTKYATPESRHRLYQDVLERLESVRGVTSAAITNAVPLAGLRPGQTRLQIDGRSAGSEQHSPTVDVRIASADYFSALGIPVLRGRGFEPTDDETAERVVVISAAAARYWDGGEPLGSRVTADGRTWYRVVGVVGDVRHFGLDVEAPAQLYAPLAQAGGNLAGRVLVRAEGDPGTLMASIREAIHGVDPDMPIERMQTLATMRASYLATPRLTALLLSIFAGLALCITVTGIAGVIAASIAQRTREIGIRIAIGASARGVLVMVFRQGLETVAIGLAAGIPLAIAFGLALRGLLFDTAPADPIMLVGVAFALAVAGTLGCLGPALRATAIDPIAALRAD